ncbi:hypothetical protein ABZ502_17390 [Streptomyces abikoensis]|uniref:hypothetical protein n=1 Tax=Streptomyces abikoensis TaxID=97398 RepID=UPI0033EEDCAF
MNMLKAHVASELHTVLRAAAADPADGDTYLQALDDQHKRDVVVGCAQAIVRHLRLDIADGGHWAIRAFRAETASPAELFGARVVTAVANGDLACARALYEAETRHPEPDRSATALRALLLAAATVVSRNDSPDTVGEPPPTK